MKEEFITSGACVWNINYRYIVLLVAIRLTITSTVVAKTSLESIDERDGLVTEPVECTRNGNFFNAINVIDNKCPYSPKLWILNNNWRHVERMIMLGSCSSFEVGTPPSHAIRGDNEHLRKRNISQAFWIDKTEVTRSEFEKFVKSTNYRSVAEHYENSFVFWLDEKDKAADLEQSSLPPGEKGERKRGWWWKEVSGVHWNSSHNNPQHPVVHVSWDDAVAFCEWRGGRLPTETEWEYSCWGATNPRTHIFPWGNVLYPNKTHMTNIWQGQFPERNTKKDGFLLTSPVGSFSPNSFGLFDVIGNVWEWVDGTWGDISTSTSQILSPNVRVQKGGSFLCHRNHCFRYRCGARTKATRDSTSSNVGFRCAANVLRS